MTLYVFQGGSEQALAEVKEEEGEKKLLVATKLTNYRLVPLTEKMFKDREKRNQCKLLLLNLPKLTDEQVEVYIKQQFGLMGYQLKKKLKGKNDLRTDSQ